MRARYIGRALELGAVLLPLALLSPAFLMPTVMVGEGAYEPAPDGGVVLRFGDRMSNQMFPFGARARGDALWVDPGTSVVLPIETTLHVSRDDERLAPWFLLGTQGDDIEPRERADTENQGHRLVDPLMLSVLDDGIELVPWDGLASWRTDSARLDALANACGSPEHAEVSRESDRVEVRYGTCRTSVSRSRAGARWRAAVAGEVDGAWIGRADGADWPTHVDPIFEMLFLLLLIAGCRTVAFGFRIDALVNAPCLAAWIVWPAAAGSVWLSIGAISSFALVARWLFDVAHRRWTVRHALLPLVFIGGLATVGALLLGDADSGGVYATPPPSGEPLECLLAGYSAAGNTTLPDPSWGATGTLGRECGICRERTGSWTERGETFGWFGLRLCSPSFPESTQRVAFLGGTNDDVFQARSALAGAAEQVLHITRFSLASPEGGGLGDMLETATSNNPTQSELEAREIARGLGCTSANDVSFYYFHDFTVTDLDEGRGPNRRRRFDARRRATETAGGTFVDLNAELGEGAGVAWFNDFIHPSALGHHRIGQLMCEVMSSDEP